MREQRREPNHGKVYAAECIRRGGDTVTLEILNYLYARDANQVYYPFGKIKDADPLSFQALDSGASFSGPGKFLLKYEGYARDKNSVYHYVYTIGRPSVVRLADPLTFRSIDGTFGRDERSVFLERTRIKHAQVKSWALLQGMYSCDDDFCFYGSQRIVGAQRASFICLPSHAWAKDKYRYYHCGRESTAEQYCAAFEKMITSLEMMRDSLAAGRL